jgi:hypothetical protein
MEIHPETEPLLDKSEQNFDFTFTFGKNDSENKKKSKEQILDKSWLEFEEYLCCCCINYDITQNQYNHYSDLKKQCSIKYDENNTDHEKTLEEFFVSINELIQNEDEDYENLDNININDINNNNELTKEKKLINKLSKRIGFQSDNPRTDFRAGGIYSLQFMNYFITNYKLESKNILNEKSFPFAIVCINISFLLTLVLLLNDDDKKTIEKTLESRKLTHCNRKQIKKFCEHLENENEKDLMFLIISQSLCFVFAKYIKEINNGKKDDNLVVKIIDNTVQYFKETLNNIKKNENLVDKLRIVLEGAKYKELKNL